MATENQLSKGIKKEKRASMARALFTRPSWTSQNLKRGAHMRLPSFKITRLKWSFHCHKTLLSVWPRPMVERLAAAVLVNQWTLLTSSMQTMKPKQGSRWPSTDTQSHSTLGLSGSSRLMYFTKLPSIMAVSSFKTSRLFLQIATSTRSLCPACDSNWTSGNSSTWMEAQSDLNSQFDLFAYWGMLIKWWYKWLVEHGWQFI